MGWVLMPEAGVLPALADLGAGSTQRGRTIVYLVLLFTYPRQA